MSEFSYNNQVIRLRDDNPYANGRINAYADGTAELDRDFPEYNGGEGDQYYTVKIGDELDEIAYRYYKNKLENAQRYWYVLADVNNIENPLDISDWVGRNIVIPDILNFKLIYNNA